MRGCVGPIVLCALVRVAAADGDPTWDGTYARDASGGTELCPDAQASLAVSKGAYTIVWNIRTSPKELVRVGTIEGSVRPTGYATFKATLFDPMPADAAAALARMNDTIDQLKVIAKDMQLRFTTTSQKRSIDLASGNCYARWVADAVVPPASGAKATKRAPAQPAQKLKPPPPLAAGSSKWDTAYSRTSHYSEDWRCPDGDALAKLVVSKGRFSLPYLVTARDRWGREYGTLTLGQIDGSIAADGKTKLRTWFAVSELPPELADGLKPDEATLDHVRALAPTMTFSTRGGERHATLSYGKACEVTFESASTVAKKKDRSQSTAPARASSSTAAPNRSSTSSSSRSSSSSSSSKSSTSSSSKRPPGGECESDSDCASDTCKGGQCWADYDPDFVNGSRCRKDNDCASRSCSPDKVCE